MNPLPNTNEKISNIFTIETSIEQIEKQAKITLSFKLIKDLKEAEKYWKMFSNNESLFDLWDFRYCAYKYLKFELFFYVGFFDGEPIGVLPLEWNSQKGYLEFFGGFYMEDNKVLIKEGYKNFVGEFYNQVTLPKKLSFISEVSDFEKSLDSDDSSYYVDTKSIQNFDQYIESKFSKKTGKGFKKDISRITDNHSVEILINRFEDVEIMFEYSLKNFGDKCDLILEPSESPFEKDIIKDFDTHILSFVIDGKVQAVSMLTLYNNILYGINGGINHKDIPNLGKLVFREKVNFGIKNQCDIYHVGVGDYNWKKDWRLDTIPQKKLP